MARINVEDSIYSDYRFLQLTIKIGDLDTALGAVILSWKMAQEFWCPNKKPIPIKRFQQMKFSNSLIECGLAEIVDDSVYVKGTEKHFSWYFEKVKAGKRGGEARARNQRENSLANASKPKQNVPSPSYSYSYSSSSSCSSSNTNTIDQQVDQIYQQWYPRKIGKSKGIAKLRKLPLEDIPNLEKAVKNYASFVENKPIEYVKHFSTFASEWKDWIETPIENDKEEYWKKVFGDDYVPPSK